MTRTRYCGRFAPSPTGPLHFGSLVAALGSYLDARAAGGLWLVRMEDLDPPREVPGAADAILRSLAALGLHWDGEVMYQSRRSAAYDEALTRLLAGGRAYPCACSRKEIETALADTDASVYPGTCRNGLADGRTARSVRARVDSMEITFDDAIQGRFAQQLDREVGDFVIRRADGFTAYQLAVAVDDAEQGITHVVRGSDLLDSTPRQILLQQQLGYPVPDYAHLPLAIDAGGAKLSKQTRAPAIDTTQPSRALWAALRFLGQAPAVELADATPDDLLNWAIHYWERSSIPPQRTLQPQHAVTASGSTVPAAGIE